MRVDDTKKKLQERQSSVYDTKNTEFVLTICKFTNRQNETNNSKISYFLYIFYDKKNPRSQ